MTHPGDNGQASVNSDKDRNGAVTVDESIQEASPVGEATNGFGGVSDAELLSSGGPGDVREEVRRSYSSRNRRAFRRQCCKTAEHDSCSKLEAVQNARSDAIYGAPQHGAHGRDDKKTALSISEAAEGTHSRGEQPHDTTVCVQQDPNHHPSPQLRRLGEHSVGDGDTDVQAMRNIVLCGCRQAEVQCLL